MGAMNRALEVYSPFGFAIPVPEHLLGRVIAWFEKNASLGGMALVQGEARFSDAHWADTFADEVGADWNVHD